jgi:hypothetical protein
MKKLLWLSAPFVLALGVMTGGVAGFAAPSAPPTAPPGQGECSHGNTGKPCKPDPQPDQGKDCETHGNDGVGGVNEDHCLGTSPTTSTDATTTDQTTTDQTTTNETTTTNKTTTPVTTTSTEEVTTSSQTATTTTSATLTTAESSNDGPSGSAPAVTKPELEGVLAEQATRVATGRVSPEHNVAGELPFTGSSAWIVALFGAAILAAGLGVRRLTA